MTEYRVIRTYPFSDSQGDRTIDLCYKCIVEWELKDDEILTMIPTSDNRPYKTCEVCGVKSFAYKHLHASQNARLRTIHMRKTRKGK